MVSLYSGVMCFCSKSQKKCKALTYFLTAEERLLPTAHLNTVITQGSA
jgi:hypothetical protein